MIRTILTPTKSQVLIDIPIEYIGKSIEISFLALDELNDPKLKSKTASSFRGKLEMTKFQQEELEKHLNETKKEWQRDF